MRHRMASRARAAASPGHALERPTRRRRTCRRTPAADGWLVSHRLGLLDGEVTSPYLLRLFGWQEPPRPAVVCAQLVHFASGYDAAVGPCGAELWRVLLTPAYTQLSQLVETLARHEDEVLSTAKMMTMLDTDGSGQIMYDHFEAWWLEQNKKKQR